MDQNPELAIPGDGRRRPGAGPLPAADLQWRPGWRSVVLVVLFGLAVIPLGVESGLVPLWAVLSVVLLIGWLAAAIARLTRGHQGWGPGTWRWLAAPVVIGAALWLTVDGTISTLRIVASRDALHAYASDMRSRMETADLSELREDGPRWIGLYDVVSVVADASGTVRFITDPGYCIFCEHGAAYSPGRWPALSARDVEVVPVGGDFYRYELRD